MKLTMKMMIAALLTMGIAYAKKEKVTIYNYTTLGPRVKFNLRHAEDKIIDIPPGAEQHPSITTFETEHCFKEKPHAAVSAFIPYSHIQSGSITFDEKRCTGFALYITGKKVQYRGDEKLYYKKLELTVK